MHTGAMCRTPLGWATGRSNCEARRCQCKQFLLRVSLPSVQIGQSCLHSLGVVHSDKVRFVQDHLSVSRRIAEARKSFIDRARGALPGSRAVAAMGCMGGCSALRLRTIPSAVHLWRARTGAGHFRGEPNVRTSGGISGRQ